MLNMLCIYIYIKVLKKLNLSHQNILTYSTMKADLHTKKSDTYLNSMQGVVGAENVRFSYNSVCTIFLINAF